MTTHELAKYLLGLPNKPVVINGWGSDEGNEREVGGAVDGGDGTIGLGYYEDGEWAMQGPRLEPGKAGE